MNYPAHSPIVGRGQATPAQIDRWFASTPRAEIPIVPIATVTHPSRRMANCRCSALNTGGMKFRPRVDLPNLIARPMQSGMFRLRHYRKILGAVVGVVAVDVMHNLARSQQATEHLFSDNAVLGNKSPAGSVGMVGPIQIDVSPAVRALTFQGMPWPCAVDSQAIEGTVLAGGGAVGAFVELRAADDTCTLDAHGSHLSRVVPGTFAASPGFPIHKPNSTTKGGRVASI